jgi:DNA primase
MNKNIKAIGCAEARTIDIVDYLSKEGIQPTKIHGNDYWYLSPLREEKTASFKVNRKINCWYDHGAGKGGNIIDFALLFHNCKLSQWLQSLSDGHWLIFPAKNAFPDRTIKELKLITVLEDSPITSQRLVDYLSERKISLSIATIFCREVKYTLRGKNYYGIGFKNDAGGFEIRNAFYKNGSSPKAMTTIKNGNKKIAVFEGFFDFLSAVSLLPANKITSCDFCILNSLSFFETARPFLETYNSIFLFLDNDLAGNKIALSATASSSKYIDKSILYKDYKDVNAWHLCNKPPPDLLNFLTKPAMKMRLR